MKKNLQVLLFLTALFTAAKVSAQTPLPYYTGFDNTNEQAGWQEFRKGYIGTYEWGLVSFNAVSPPNFLFHDYEVGGDPNDTIQDWYVSPAFDFSGGGKIDSIKVDIYAFFITAIDHCGLFLLEGSNDPALATNITELADLTQMANSAGVWRDTGNFVIPPTAGTCYIGIMHMATNNWYTPKIDNINISGSTTGISKINNVSVNIFPNPVKDYLYLTTSIPQKGIFNITDCLGNSVKTFSFESSIQKMTIDVADLPAGIYFVGREGTDDRLKFLKQ